MDEFSFLTLILIPMKQKQMKAISPLTWYNRQPLPVHSLAFSLHTATTPPLQWPPAAPLWQV